MNHTTSSKLKLNEKREIQIIDSAKLIHSEFRNNNSNVQTQTKTAIEITKKWQKDIRKLYDVEVEFLVSQNRTKSEKIDIVDLEEMTAYELKVSGKNPHHEFYKDLIKILKYNCNNSSNPIEKFVFLTEENGINSLQKRFTEDIKVYLQDTHKIKIELKSIN
jgi:hypothetical protein